MRDDPCVAFSENAATSWSTQQYKPDATRTASVASQPSSLPGSLPGDRASRVIPSGPEQPGISLEGLSTLAVRPSYRSKPRGRWREPERQKPNDSGDSVRFSRRAVEFYPTGLQFVNELLVVEQNALLVFVGQEAGRNRGYCVYTVDAIMPEKKSCLLSYEKCVYLERSAQVAFTAWLRGASTPSWKLGSHRSGPWPEDTPIFSPATTGSGSESPRLCMSWGAWFSVH